MKRNPTSNQTGRNMFLSLRAISLSLIFSGLFQTLLPAQAEEYSPEEYLRDYLILGPIETSDFETDFSDEVRKATEHVIERNDIGWIPTISTGFTDSRFTRPLGVITYGFMGSHPDDDPMQDRIHGTDESIGISSLVNSTKIMLALAYNMLAK